MNILTQYEDFDSTNFQKSLIQIKASVKEARRTITLSNMKEINEFRNQLVLDLMVMSKTDKKQARLYLNIMWSLPDKTLIKLRITSGKTNKQKSKRKVKQTNQLSL